MTKNIVVTLALLGLAVGAPAISHAQFITNGNFESTTNGKGQQGYNTNLTGWSTNSGAYNFIFTSGSADTTGATGEYGNLKLWGPGSGSNNGLTASSPDGGNFLAADGAFGTRPVYQTITGLTVGNTYDVSFYWAAAQQAGYTGDTTSQWSVTFAGVTKSTAIVSNPSKGFSGWMAQTFSYKATSTSHVLSFLANGTPTGVPPFALLDGVKMSDTTNVPEPASILTMLVGATSFGLFVRRRRNVTR